MIFVVDFVTQLFLYSLASLRLGRTVGRAPIVFTGAEATRRADKAAAGCRALDGV